MTNAISKISDKLEKVSEEFTVHMYDNGFMIQIGGTDSNEDWKTVKIIANSIEHVIDLVKEAASMERRD